MDPKVILNAVPEILTQLAAFLVVFWVLKSYAFKPVLAMIDARRKTVEDGLTDLEKRKKGLESLEHEYRAKIEHIEQEARVKIQEAARQGSLLSKDIQEKARQDAQRLVERAKADIDQEIAKAKLELRDQIVDLSGLMTEKVMKERLDPEAHKRLVVRLLEEVGKN